MPTNIPTNIPTSSALIDADFIKELVSYEAGGWLTPHEVLLYSLQFTDERTKQAMRDELQMRVEVRRAIRWFQENT